MQKKPLLAALVLAAGCSWAFYPKSVHATYQHLLLVSTLSTAPDMQYNASLTTFEPDGTFHTEEVSGNLYSAPDKQAVAASVSVPNDKTIYTIRRDTYVRNLLLQKELQKVNELTAKGWELVATAPDHAGIRYIFQKAK